MVNIVTLLPACECCPRTQEMDRTPAITDVATETQRHREFVFQNSGAVYRRWWFQRKSSVPLSLCGAYAGKFTSGEKLDVNQGGWWSTFDVNAGMQIVSARREIGRTPS